MNSIMTFLDGQKLKKTDKNHLPSFHSCEAYSAMKIIDGNELIARKCKVFKENLLYLFYGKPSYSVSEKFSDVKACDNYFPVCFIIDTNKINIYKVFPFDTGAFKRKMYAPFIHRHAEISDFEMEGGVDTIEKYIEIFFDNDENYINGEVVLDKTGNPEMDMLLKLFNQQGICKVDERASTVEIMTRDNIGLTEAVECIILPQKLLMQNPGMEKILTDNGIKYKTYKTRFLQNLERMDETVFGLARDYIEGKCDDDEK